MHIKSFFLALLWIANFAFTVQAFAQSEGGINWKSAFVLAVEPDLSEEKQIDTLNYLRVLGKNEGEEDIDALYHNALGIYYYQINQYPKMLQNVLKAMELNKASGSKRLLSMNYNMLSLYYQDIGRPEKALEPQMMAKNLAEELEETHLAYFYSSNLATLYMVLKKYEEALPIHQKNLKHFIEKKDTINICSELYNLAFGYYNIGEGKKALTYLYELDKYYNNDNGQWEIKTMAQVLLGIINQEQKKYQLAEEAYLNAYEIAKQIQSLSNISIVAEKLQKLHEEKGSYKEALHWAKVFKLNSDSIFNEQSFNNLNELEVAYEADLRKQELAAAEAKLEVLNKQNILYVIMFTFSILVVLLLSLVYYNRSKLKEGEVKISHQKINELIAKQELESLQISLQAKEEERSRIARELHDHMSSKMAALKLNFTYWLKKNQLDSEESTQTLSQIIFELANDVRRISHDLSADEKGRLNLETVLQNLQKQINAQKQIQFDLTLFGMLDKLPNELELNIFRIVQELTSNTLKHANASKINVSVTQIQDEITLMYDDDGKGFDLAKISANPGIGLKNIRTRVQTSGAHLQFDTSPGSGFNAVVVFPITVTIEV